MAETYHEPLSFFADHAQQYLDGFCYFLENFVGPWPDEIPL